MSAEAVTLLREIRDELRAIRTDMAARTVPLKRKDSARSRLSKLAAEARESLADQTRATVVVQVWAEVCPGLPQPDAGLDADRRRQCRELYAEIGEDGVRALFRTVARDDWLCGRTRPNARKPIGLWETIRKRRDIVEGTAR